MSPSLPAPHLPGLPACLLPDNTRGMEKDPNEPVKITFVAPRFARRALREEALKRDMTISQIIMEALTRRVMVYTMNEAKEKENAK